MTVKTLKGVVMRKKILKAFSFFAVLIVLCFAGTGCNTIKGMGEDIESGGEAIQGAAD